VHKHQVDNRGRLVRLSPRWGIPFIKEMKARNGRLVIEGNSLRISVKDVEVPLRGMEIEVASKAKVVQFLSIEESEELGKCMVGGVDIGIDKMETLPCRAQLECESYNISIDFRQKKEVVKR
jgi:hypothetical protein